MRFKFKPSQKYKIEEIRTLLDWTHGQIVSLLKSDIEKATHSKPVKILGKVLNKWLAENPEPKTETQKSMAYLRDCPRLSREFLEDQLSAERESQAIEQLYRIAAIVRQKRPRVQSDVDRSQESGIRKYSGKMIGPYYIFRPQ